MGLKITVSKRKEENNKKVFIDGLPYIWVDGYKGTDRDMRCRGYQYEIGKEFECNGNIRICNNGFHFCTYLSDVIDRYYDFDGNNRFFKVKALIPFDDSKTDKVKYAAKKIIFLEEVGYKQLERYIVKYCPLIKTEEEWIECSKLGYTEFVRNRFKTEMSKFGYSDTFIDVLFDDKGESRCDDVIQKARAFYEENVSKDLSVYMLMQFC